MRCTRCREHAVIELRRHNAAFCADCFQGVFRNQVARAIDEYDMIETDDRILVAVSGGKDSLALWDVLLGAGYHADGLYLGLGIGGDSDPSPRLASALSQQAGGALPTIHLPTAPGVGNPPPR